MGAARTPFTCGLSRTERRLGLLYLPLHIFALPLLLGIFTAVSTAPVSQAKLSTVYYLIGLVYILLLLRRGLRGDWDRLLDNKLQVLLALILAYLLSMVLSYAVSIAMLLLLGDGQNPNNAAVSEIVSGGNYQGMTAALLCLSPVVEETLFRGVLFGGLREKNRAAAYIVSTAAFALYHVWQYAVAAMDWRVLLYALQYIPAAVALAWCYERTGSLWTPVLYHAMNNLAALLTMQLM